MSDDGGYKLEEIQIPTATGCFRLDFQVAAAAHAKGRVLNLACNEDPAGLRARFGSTILNCDLEIFDSHLNRPNPVDKQFNMLEFPWPFEDGYVNLSILGDILEHFPRSEMVKVLNEVRRVSDEVCITVPEDKRINEEKSIQEWSKDKYNLHTTIVTQQFLRDLLQETGWQPYIFLAADWGFQDNPPTVGYCCVCYKK